MKIKTEEYPNLTIPGERVQSLRADVKYAIPANRILVWLLVISVII